MVKTIGNPMTWGVEALAGTGRAMGEVAEGLGRDESAVPVIHDIGMDTIAEALTKGVADALHFRSDVFFLVTIYPVIGATLAFLAFHLTLLPLVFPLAAGFSLLGPVAAIGLYELSRQRERGLDGGWGGALSVLRSKVVGPVVVLGVYLLVLFTFWMFAAQAIFDATLGPAVPATLSAFAGALFTTAAGWEMIVLGIGVGFLFAVVVLVMSLTSFPMLIDRQVGLPLAVATSVRVALRNPGPVAAWGMIVAVLLVLGSLPAFLGLIVTMPVLGHATWHLYRAAVSYEDG